MAPLQEALWGKKGSSGQWKDGLCPSRCVFSCHSRSLHQVTQVPAHRGPSRLRHVHLSKCRVPEGLGLFPSGPNRSHSCTPLPHVSRKQEGGVGDPRAHLEGCRCWLLLAGVLLDSPGDSLTQQAPRKAWSLRGARNVKIEPRGCALQ